MTLSKVKYTILHRSGLSHLLTKSHLLSHLLTISRYTLLTELPSYMSGVLGFDMKSNALVSALPFLVMWIYSILFGSLMDCLGSRGLISRTGITKLSTAIGKSFAVELHALELETVIINCSRDVNVTIDCRLLSNTSRTLNNDVKQR